MNYDPRNIRKRDGLSNRPQQLLSPSFFIEEKKRIQIRYFLLGVSYATFLVMFFFFLVLVIG